jgi:hypothetical protein
MADLKISALPASTTPLAGTEVLPVVQSSTTKNVSVANLTAGRAVSAASQTLTSGNLNFTGTAQRLTADTTSGTLANRFFFQNNQTDGNTFFYVIPNGTGTVGGANFYNLSDPTNASVAFIRATSTEIQLQSTRAGTGTFLPMAFYVNGAKQMDMGTSGDVTISTGNVVIGTSGKGIDFSATSGSGTSELFNDYEEGTFTPDLRFGGAKVGMAGTFTGNYTKIGRTVNVQVRIALTNKGVSTGVATIEGLPFTSSTFPAAIIDPSNTWVLTGAAFVGLASTTLYLLQQTSTGRTTLSDTNLSNDSDLRLEVTYIV